MKTILRIACLAMLSASTLASQGVIIPSSGQAFGSSGGTLPQGVAYSLLTRREGLGKLQVTRLSAVILWRDLYSPDSADYSDKAWKEGQRAFGLKRTIASDSGRLLAGSYQGGIAYSAEFDEGFRWLWVLGNQFAIPQPDSTLVIMVEQTNGKGGAPRIAGVERLVARLPDNYFGKTWRAGDTTFTVRAVDPPDVLLKTLNQSPVIARFIKFAAIR